MRSVVERLRPLAGDMIGIRANQAGTLQLYAETDAATATVSWHGLSNPRMGAYIPSFLVRSLPLSCPC